MGYLENHLNSSMTAKDLERDLIRNNQDISQNISILASPTPLCRTAAL